MVAVLMSIFRPVVETEVRRRVSGSDCVIEREPREVTITPETGVPAESATLPFATTVCSRTPLKLFPALACEDIAPLVRTTNTAPGGTVAPNKNSVVSNETNKNATPDRLALMNCEQRAAEFTLIF